MKLGPRHSTLGLLALRTCVHTKGCSEPPLSVIFGLGLWPLSFMLSALLCQLMTKRTVQRKLPGTLVARGNLERTPRELLRAVFGFYNQISQCSPGWPRTFSSSPSLPPPPTTARITRISSYWRLPGTRPVPSSQPGARDLFHLSNHPLRLEPESHLTDEQAQRGCGIL